MINVIHNQKPYHMPEASTLKEFLVHIKYQGTYAAIAVNQNFVPKTSYSNHILCDQDKVDIVTPMQGG